jgi:hypothetical protein
VVRPGLALDELLPDAARIGQVQPFEERIEIGHLATYRSNLSPSNDEYGGVKQPVKRVSATRRGGRRQLRGQPAGCSSAVDALSAGLRVHPRVNGWEETNLWLSSRFGSSWPPSMPALLK